MTEQGFCVKIALEFGADHS